jgi:hypothetical protein
VKIEHRGEAGDDKLPQIEKMEKDAAELSKPHSD